MFTLYYGISISSIISTTEVRVLFVYLISFFLNKATQRYPRSQNNLCLQRDKEIPNPAYNKTCLMCVGLLKNLQ